MNNESIINNPMEHFFGRLDYISKIIKFSMLKTIKHAQTGHLGACCSSNELLSVLYFSGLFKFDIINDKHPDRSYCLIRGHLGPLRYNIFAYLGWLNKEEMTDYRKFGSRLHGHEDMNITPGVDLTPSGSLGMLLSYSVGAAISFRDRGMDNKIWCFLGDGEFQSGNISEAARHASNMQLRNLIVVIDKNGKQLSTDTNTTDRGSNLAEIWKGYGWDVIEIDGHNIKEIYQAYLDALYLCKIKLVCIIANTIKGNGIENALSHYCGYHVYHNNIGHATSNNINIDAAITSLKVELNNLYGSDVSVNLLEFEKETFRKLLPNTSKPSHRVDYIPIDCDNSAVKESSYDYLYEFLLKYVKINSGIKTYILTADYPPRNMVYDTGKFFIDKHITYINVGIREQHLFSMVHGLKSVDPDCMIIVLCGDGFMYRCADQINVLAQSNDHVIIYSVQAGMSGAQNGFTHQSIGIAGCYLSIPGIEFYESATKVDWYYAMNRALGNRCGVKYIRTHNGLNSFNISDTVTKQSLYHVNIGTDAKFTVATCGMITDDAFEALNQINNNHGIASVLINIVNLSDLQGIGQMVIGNKPLFIFYNGNPKVLSQIVSRQLLVEKSYPSEIYEHGFLIGTTGKIDELKINFSLDTNGIYTTVASALLKYI